MSTAANRGLKPIEVSRLIEGILERQPRAMARAISLVESRGAGRRELIREIYPRTGRARIVGVTGPPGAGKSTLVDRLARLLRGSGATVGILAVDPTSPFTGGAILGDRIRMQTLYTDPGVFIRSMATRGAMGGLAPATHDAIDILDAAGFDWILLETVGVGQDEVDVVRSVPTVVLVTLPGLGDDIQAIKAGIMEIADVFVVNKADRDGVERAQSDLEMMVSLADNPPWRPKVLRTVASRAEGVEELLAEIENHRKWLDESGELRNRRRSQLRLRVENVLKEKILERADETVGLDKEIDRALRDGIDPYAVADGLYEGVIGAESSPSDAADAAKETLGMIEGIDHIGIAVESIEGARGFYEALGLKVETIEEVPQEGVRVAIIPCGASRIELLEPTSTDSPVARFLERSGPGMHHLCLATGAILEADQVLRAGGYRVLRDQPTLGAEGRRVQFVHPRSATGVLVELSQASEEYSGAAMYATGTFEPGAIVMLHLINPNEKFWGVLDRLDSTGVVLRGIGLSSFDDWMLQVAKDDSPSLGLATMFLPLFRVEKIFLDEKVGAVESYSDRFESRVGKTVEAYLSVEGKRKDLP